MFSQKIEHTPFTTGNANEFFENVVREINHGADDSLLSTLRALLPQRIGTNTLRIQYSTSKYSASDVSNTTLKHLAVYMLGENPSEYKDRLYIHGINGEAPDRNANLKLIKARFARTFSGFERVQKVTDFFRKSFEVVCYVNPQSRTTVLFIDKITVRKFHAVQSAIFACLPWYFDPAQGVSQDELDLILSLQEKTEEKYMEILNRMFEKIDIRSSIIRKRLKGFEARGNERRIAELKSNIESDNGSIDSYLRQIAEVVSRRNERMLNLNALIEMTKNSPDEIMEYFLCNKNLDLENTSGSTIEFTVRGQLVYYNEELAKKTINKETSFIYSYNRGAGISNEDWKMLMLAIFVDQVLHIQACGTFKLKTDGYVSAVSGRDYNKTIYADYIPNPHLWGYHCLGTHSAAIAECINEGNMVGAVEQCVASNATINFADSTVMNTFMQCLAGRNDSVNHKCIQLPDGSVVEAKQAIEWLHAQNKEGEATANE